MFRSVFLSKQEFLLTTATRKLYSHWSSQSIKVTDDVRAGKDFHHLRGPGIEAEIMGMRDLYIRASRTVTSREYAIRATFLYREPFTQVLSRPEIVKLFLANIVSVA